MKKQGRQNAVVSSRKNKYRRGLSGLALIALSTGCANQSISVLDPAGPVGREQLSLIKLSTGIMTFVVLVVAILYLYVVIRYRERPGQENDQIPEQVEGNKKLEVLWTVVPILLLVILAIPTIATTFHQAKKPEEANTVRVHVTAYQYWWAFDYPELDITTANEVHIPVGRPIELMMKSHDVIHAFWVPSLGGKQDVNPGRTDRLVLQADKPGIFEGKCTELCGASHALMNFRVIAHPAKEFDQWVASQKNPVSTPTTKTGTDGQKWVGQNCIGCHAIENAGYRIKGKTGPNLTAFSKRTRIAGVLDNNEQNLKAWLKDTQGIKPGNRMPAFDHLTNEQIDAITQYLLQLK
ncbi:cytochrome c oxidase subunit II [Desmospora activa]|uniref:Cytochrome c oxidase subunit 2 n=1 Tax=Desmospora activa DSM 45169 TaxID=1121389 RepID=A0A2T4Z3H0_9BACL|nr:cytochrome c oxidase subunit II [Desmospora activa]PTM56434.1 cytochrome c oxidase subunit 2 [Desmospora activa DSM 45169]